MMDSGPKRFENMNVIPLIDVMLVLLAIVMMTASFIVKDNLNIELPETTNTQSYVPQKDKKNIHFAINDNNEYFVNDKSKNIESIKAFLQTLNSEQAITLQVDKKANFGTFVSLVDAFKGNKLNNLTILTKSKSE